jgi:hypothetical protein
MFALGALALAATDVAFMSPPPHRSSRPARRSEGVGGAVRGLIRSIRRAVSESLDASASGWMPVLRNYPN